ncbi:MAG: DUF5615 family PIN-like protein [Verrucomicrobiia bacterium]
MDNQLPVALARHLNGLGHDACHVLEINLAESSDREIWHHAIEEGRVMVSKDQDFFHLANAADEGFLVWIRLGNCRKPDLLAALDRCLPQLEAAVGAGHRVMEIR